MISVHRVVISSVASHATSFQSGARGRAGPRGRVQEHHNKTGDQLVIYFDSNDRMCDHCTKGFLKVGWWTLGQYGRELICVRLGVTAGIWFGNSGRTWLGQTWVTHNGRLSRSHTQKAAPWGSQNGFPHNTTTLIFTTLSRLAPPLSFYQQQHTKAGKRKGDGQINVV